MPCDVATLHVKSDNLGAPPCGRQPPRGFGQFALQQAPPAPNQAQGGHQPRPASSLGHTAGMFRLAGHSGHVSHIGALRFYERYGFVVDPDGFCKDHYLIEGVLYDAYRLTYSLPPPQSLSLLSFLPRCTVV